jgi:hypothetical protein
MGAVRRYINVFPVNTIPDKAGKPAFTHCLCDSQATGFEDLIDYTLDTFLFPSITI